MFSEDDDTNVRNFYKVSLKIINNIKISYIIKIYIFEHNRLKMELINVVKNIDIIKIINIQINRDPTTSFPIFFPQSCPLDLI